jgi:DNA-binding protein HU-beta
VNKGEFVDRVSAETDLSGAHIHVLGIVIGLIIASLASNKEILLTGFGKFDVRARRESKKINPRTQKKITVPKRVAAAFKPGENLKDIVAKD